MAQETRFSDILDADEAIKIISTAIRNSKYEKKIYIAGGYVRDSLLGLKSKDVDLVVDGHGLEGGIEAAQYIAKELNIYSPGSNPVIFPRFGTAKLTIRLSSGKPFDIEFVAPRTEKYEVGSRKPIVAAGTMQEDAYRRDFTINALFKNLTTGEILDLTGRSITDLKRKVIQTTGSADWIFNEDPLRILRAVRFAFKYNFDLPLSVIRSIKTNAAKLKNISAERIQDELNKILVLEKPSKAIKLFRITGILNYIMPELQKLHKLKQNQYHKHDAFGHTLSVLDAAPKDLLVRISALFHDIGKAATKTEKAGKIQFIGHANVGAQIAVEIMKRLKYSNEDISKVQKAVLHHMDLKSGGPEGIELQDKTLRKFIYRVSDSLESTLKLIHADNISHADAHSMPRQIENIRARISKMDVDSILNTKSILDGNDLMALGAKGKVIGEIKNRILEKIIENPQFTKDQAINLAKSIIKLRK